MQACFRCHCCLRENIKGRTFCGHHLGDLIFYKLDVFDRRLDRRVVITATIRKGGPNWSETRRQNATKMQPKFCEVTDALGEDDKLIRDTDCGRLTDEDHTSVGTVSSILSPTMSSSLKQQQQKTTKEEEEEEEEDLREWKPRKTETESMKEAFFRSFCVVLPSGDHYLTWRCSLTISLPAKQKMSWYSTNTSLREPAPKTSRQQHTYTTCYDRPWSQNTYYYIVWI